MITATDFKVNILVEYQSWMFSNMPTRTLVYLMENSEDEDIKLPPIKLPEPDPFDKPDKGSSKKGKKSKKKKGRHPLDGYKDVRKEKKGGCCGCLGILALILLLVVGVFGFCGYVMFGEAKDYNVVQLESRDEIISSAPDVATFFVGQGNVTYNAPQTTVPIMILGQNVEVSGDFSDNLSLRGSQITCRVGTHVRGDFSVYAVKYIDEGIQVDGTKSGKMLQ